ncbi:MAG: dolichyl-phosphate beta-glucosyltransferase [bacterium]
MRHTHKARPLFVSLIIPAFNEEYRIPPTLNCAMRYFDSKDFCYEIIVVDDGSSDQTTKVCKEIFGKNENFRMIDLQKNHGKGFAIMTGIEQAQGQYILFADADNSTPIEEFEKFLPHLSPDKIVIGSRFLQPEMIERKQPWFRIAISRIANLFIRCLVVKKIRDTQCGFKVFHNSVGNRLAHLQQIHRFGFDIEYLAIAQQNGIEILEMPVRWINSPASRIRPIRDTLRTLVDLLRVKINLRAGVYKKADAEITYSQKTCQ